MAMTPINAGLPWWAASGAQTGDGAPGGDMQAWLDYLSQMGGVQGSPRPQQAGLTIIDNTVDHGAGDIPPVSPVAPPPVAAASVPPGPMTGPAGPVGNLPTPSPIAAPGAAPMRPPNTAGLTPGALSSASLGAYNQMPFPNQRDTQGVFAPTPAASIPPQSSSAPGSPVAGPLASGGAGAGAIPNPRFVQLDRGQNMDPTARRGSPQMTALNLAGLFGGGGAAAPAANVPAANAQPVSATRRVPGPLAATAPGRADLTPAAVASAVSKPNWWRSLGRPDMTPDQLARAVKKPNWWQNV